MSQETEKQERGRLQHAAEHERPNKRNSVLFYLVILFAAAFVLLLMSFLMQQRANQAALDDLQQTSDSTVQSLENMLQENESLKEQNAELQAQVDALEEQVNSAQTDTGETDALQRQLDALTYLNQIRALYNEGRYADARDVAAAAESALAGNGGMEGVLGEVSAALTDQEREKMTALLSSGFTDSFRFLYPDVTGVYSWWSYRFNARKNNAGWRIDYFIVSDRLQDKIKRAEILTNVEGSDHCPVLLELDL